MEQQQRLAGDGFADEALAHRGEALAALGVGQGHVQFADLEEVDIGHRQPHEDPEYAGQQGGGAAHGDIAHLAQGVAEVHPQVRVDAAGHAGDRAAGRRRAQQAEADQGFPELVRVGRFADEGQRAQLVDTALGLFLDIPGNHHHLGLQALVANPAEHLVAVHYRHGEVEQNHLAVSVADSF
ncbi:hypothetical protein D9M68_777830 [compost metagenome]